MKSNHVFIIAEAGVNHNGDINIAKQMIDKAVDCGADAIKFQTFKTENLVSKSAKKAEYQIKNTHINSEQFSMLKQLELSYENFLELNNHCKKKGIKFLSTPFDLESIDFLQSLDLEFWKIPSGEINNLPYLVKIAETKKPVVLSTGMSNPDEISDAVNVLKANGTSEIKLLHCNTEYPTPYEDVNLLAMQTLKKIFKCEVGYSDHTKGIEVALAAAALGATIIEKHYTLDKNMIGPDHLASLEPSELKAMVKGIRNIEDALGTDEKRVSKSEEKNIAIARKSIVAKRAIQKGEVLSEHNITTKRPGNGISPMKWHEVLGTPAVKDFCEDELIVMQHKEIFKDKLM